MAEYGFIGNVEKNKIFFLANFNMETIIILLIGLGIFILNYKLQNKMSTCPKKKVVYNYMPRTQVELDTINVPEQNVIEMTKNLFDSPSPWVDRVNNRRDGLNDGNINLYYISQY